MAEYALVGVYKFVDTEGRDVTFEYGNFDVSPKTEIPTSIIKTPFGNTDVRFVFSEKRKGWEYQIKDPKSIEWTTRAFTIGEFTENSKWEDPRTPEKIIFIVELRKPPTVFGIIFDNNKNIISNNSVYRGTVQWEVRKSKTDKWEKTFILSQIINGKIGLEERDITKFQKYAEARATILVNGFQEKQITFNPKILSNKTGELPLRILMDRVSKTDKKQAIIDGLETKTTNVKNKLK